MSAIGPKRTSLVALHMSANGTRKASLEAKTPDDSPTGIGSCRDVIGNGRRRISNHFTDSIVAGY